MGPQRGPEVVRNGSGTTKRCFFSDRCIPADCLPLGCQAFRSCGFSSPGTPKLMLARSYSFAPQERWTSAFLDRSIRVGFYILPLHRMNTTKRRQWHKPERLDTQLFDFTVFCLFIILGGIYFAG